MERSKNVTDSRAGDRFQGAAAHPDPERHFQVLAAPHVHALVVRAEIPEILSVHREQAAGHRRTVRRADRIASPQDFPLRNVHPSEMAAPGEAADLERRRIAVIVLEGLVVDDVDNWHEHSFLALFDSLQ